MNEEREPVDPTELDKPVPKNSLPPLPLLPEREWISAKISKVEYRKVYFNGKLQYVQNKEGEDVIDEKTGKKIERREFNVTIELLHYSLPSGDTRKGWVYMGCSFGKNAKLPKVLKRLNFTLNEESLPTPRDIVSFMEGKPVLLQYINKIHDDGFVSQKIDPESLKPNEDMAKTSTNEQSILENDSEEAWDE